MKKLNLWMFLLLGLLPFSAAPLFAAEGDETMGEAEAVDEMSIDEMSIEDVIVVGSRRPGRTATQSAGPVDVFTPEQLSNSVVGDFRDTLRQTIPSFNVTRIPLSDAPSLSRPATMRGLSPDHTLVLLNGKRRHRGAIVSYASPSAVTRGSQPVDFGAIPSIALQRLEILRDGASAQYGSDAIAGVMNAVIREDTNVMNFSLGSGYYDRKSDGESVRFQFYAGFDLPRDGFITVALEGDRDDLTSRGREHPAVTNLRGGGAASFNENRVLGADSAPALQRGTPLGVLPIDTTQTFNPYSREYPAITWGNPDTSNLRGLVNFGMQLNANTKVYALLTFATMSAEIDFFWRTPVNRGGIFNVPDNARGAAAKVLDPKADKDALAAARAASAAKNEVFDCNNPRDSANAVCIANTHVGYNNMPLMYMDVRALYPGGYTPIMSSEVEDDALTFGVKGERNGWNYDVSVSSASNWVEFQLGDSLNPSMFPLANGACALDNTALATQCAIGSEAHLDDLKVRASRAQTTFDIGALEQQESSLNADFSKLYLLSSGGEFNLAWGVEARTDGYTITAGENASWDYLRDYTKCAAADPVVPEAECTEQLYTGVAVGSHGLPGFAASVAGDWERDSKAIYLDIELDLSDRAVLGFAYRMEDYDDFGQTKNAKLSLRHNISDRLTWRTTVSSGFRAPTVGQIYTSVVTTSSVTGGGDLVQVGTYRVGHPAAKFKGSQTLDPETATNISFGFAGDLGQQGGTWSADYYKIRVKDRIGLSRFIQVTDDDRKALLPIIGPDANTLERIRYFTNDFDTSTEGFDLVFTSPISEQWKYSLAYNRNRTSVTSHGPALGYAEVGDIENQTPKQRLNSTFTLTTASWMYTLSANYYGRWSDYNNNPSNNYNGSSALLFNMGLNWNITPNMQLRWGVENFFDKYPRTISGTCCGQRYNDFTPYGYNGRHLSVRYAYTYETGL